jgi:hypothetical protein
MARSLAQSVNIEVPAAAATAAAAAAAVDTSGATWTQDAVTDELQVDASAATEAAGGSDEVLAAAVSLDR